MQRLRQDVSYISQGFVVTLTMLSVLLLLVAAIALVLLALMPGSLGIALREVFPPVTLMVQLAVGGVGIFILLWGLSYIHYLPKRMSLRLRWLVGVSLAIALVTATILGSTSSASG